MTSVKYFATFVNPYISVFGVVQVGPVLSTWRLAVKPPDLHEDGCLSYMSHMSEYS